MRRVAASAGGDVMITGSSSEYDAYLRGQDAGRIEQRLQGHDDHFKQINGSIDAMTTALQDLTDELHAKVRHLAAGVTSDRRDTGEREKIAVTVAAALVEQATTTRTQRTRRWTSWGRAVAVLGAISLLANFALALYVAFNR
jgi:hypothetical protein